VRIAIAVGVFFVVLAVVFAVAARGDYRAAKRQWTPGGKTRRRIALLFAVVGLGLIFWQLSGR